MLRTAALLVVTAVLGVVTATTAAAADESAGTSRDSRPVAVRISISWD